MANSIIGTLIYKITGDSSALEQSLDKAQKQITKTGTSLEALGKRATKVATAVFSGVFVKSILEASSRVEELESKFNTVFSGIEATADAWAREYADATNRGVTSTKEFLATQQDLRTGYGDSTEAAMKYAQAVVGVTNDLASFSNVPVEEAMQAINSGLSGQFEALRRLGVGLNTNIINQSEYAKSINKTWDEMSNLEKQEAVLSGIMNQSKNAIHQNVQVWTEYDYKLGDAALTSESFANSTQGLTQRFDDLKAELGDSLLPIATSIVGIATDAIKVFNSWDDSVQSLTVAALAFGVAMTTIGGTIGAVIGALGSLLIVFGNNKDTIDNLKTSTDKLKNASSNYGEYTKQLKENVNSLTKEERLLLEVRKEQAKLDAQESLRDAKKAYTEATKKLSKNNSALQTSKAYYEAYWVAIENGTDGVSKKIKEYESNLSQLSEQEEKTYSVLLGIEAMRKTSLADITEENFIKTIKEFASEEYDTLVKLQEYQANYDSTRLELITSLSQALEAGVLDAKTLELIYPDLVEDVNAYRAAIESETVATEEQSEAISKVVTATKQWRDTRASQMADLLEEQGEYKKAAELRIALLEKEKEEDLKALAVSSGVIQEGQELTEESLQEALSSSGEFLAEYEALVAYYASLVDQELSKEKKAEEELFKTRESNADTWISKLREQDIATRESAALAYEAQEDLQSAYEIRYALLDEEREREEAALKAKIDANEATQEDLLNLQKYYANEREKISTQEDEAIAALKEAKAKEAQDNLDKELKKEEELAKFRESNTQAWNNKLKQQSINEKESLASTLEAEGQIVEAYKIRYQLLDDELEEEKTKLQAKIDANEASNDDLLKIETYYQNEKAKLQAEETESIQESIDKKIEEENKLSEIRESNAQKYTNKLLEQRIANDENTANELENLGQIKEAYEIRMRLLDEEENRELEALQALIDANKATEEDKTKLKEYYANERKALVEDETQAELDSVEENLQKQKDEWKSFFSDLKSLTTDFGSAIVDLYSVMTDNAISEIERQTQARLEELGLAEQTEKEKLQEEYNAAVQAGDMTLAQEKQRALQKLQIEEEADEKKAKLQREQAKRERDLKIYTTTLDMLSAIVKYLSDPGGWAGVALSAMAATTGALQIAAIKAEALPSFDVGANYIPDDMLALVHQGETILPEPMAESIRRGDAVLGNVQPIQVTIINNTSAEVVAQEVGTDEEREVRITIGQVVSSQIETGRFDSAMGRRYGLRRIGKNV